jgi:hypothetical protein
MVLVVRFQLNAVPKVESVGERMRACGVSNCIYARARACVCVCVCVWHVLEELGVGIVLYG